MSFTTVCTSFPSILKPTTILRFPSSLVICAGPSLKETVATCDKGICKPLGAEINKLPTSSMEFLFALSKRTTKSNFLSFSYTTPAASPAKAVLIVLFTSSTLSP